MQKSIETVRVAEDKSLGGWLWVVMAILILNVLTNLLHLKTMFTGLLLEDWRSYFSTTDNLLKLRLYIYSSQILIIIGEVIINFSAIRNFFNKTKKFPAIFTVLVVYAIASEAHRIYFVYHYSMLSSIDPDWLDSNFIWIALVGVLVGLYLRFGKRPVQTFVN
ncbi:MAG: DUF2569 family protein [Bacteroidota bacterium]